MRRRCRIKWLWEIYADLSKVDISTETQTVLAKGVKDQLGVHSEVLEMHL
jgi:hypothetical protein